MNNQLISFKQGTTEAECREVLSSYGVTLHVWMDAIYTAEVELPPTRDPEGLQSFISQNEQVNIIEDDIEISAVPIIAELPQESLSKARVNVASLTITDPAFHSHQHGPQLINAPTAWQETTGSGEITIAVIDTGVMSNHEDFDGRVLPGKNFVKGEGISAQDRNGHGTHVAGIIGAGMNNRGIVGICPNCNILPIRVLNDTRRGLASFLVQGIAYAMEQGIRIINLSLGSKQPSRIVENTIRIATKEQGILIVAAAGNYGTTEPFYPAFYENVVAVSAATSQGHLWPSSNRGDYVDVLAPGIGIYTTGHDGHYTYESGTSMAAPHVSGLAGLIWSINPMLPSEEVARVITETAQKSDVLPNIGLINAAQAVKMAKSSIVPGADRPSPDPDMLNQNYKTFMPSIMN